MIAIGGSFIDFSGFAETAAKLIAALMSIKWTHDGHSEPQSYQELEQRVRKQATWRYRARRLTRWMKDE